MVNLTNFFRQASKPDSVLNNKPVAEGVNLVKNATDTPDTINAKTVTDTATAFQKTSNAITHNVQNITAKIADTISDTGGKVINAIKENPLAYTAGAGVAALTAGIVIGRISKSNKSDTPSNGDEALFYIKSSNLL